MSRGLELGTFPEHRLEGRARPMVLVSGAGGISWDGGAPGGSVSAQPPFGHLLQELGVSQPLKLPGLCPEAVRGAPALLSCAALTALPPHPKSSKWLFGYLHTKFKLLALAS